MPKYLCYGVISATVEIGIYETDSAEKALELAENDENCYVPTLCHHCARTVELGEIDTVEVEEIDE